MAFASELFLHDGYDAQMKPCVEMLGWFWICKRRAARSAWRCTICCLGSVQETLLLLLKKECFRPGLRAVIRWPDGFAEAAA